MHICFLVENKSWKKSTVKQMNYLIINTRENTNVNENNFKRSNRIKYKMCYPEMESTFKM